MKKAAKKAAIGLTLALTMSTVFACAPADRGAIDETGYRGTGVQQDRGTHFGVRGGTRQPGAIGYGTRPGLIEHPGAVSDGTRPGLIGQTGFQNRGGIFGARDGLTPRNYVPGRGYGGLGTDMRTPNDTLNRGTTQNIRGGGTLFGGAGPRMQGARTDLGRAGDARGFAGRSGLGGFNNALGAGAYDQDRVDDIKRRVTKIEGVRDARVIFHDNAVIVGVQTEGVNPNNVTRQVRQQLQGTARGEHIYVTTDRGMFDRIGGIDDRLRGGGAQPFREAANEIGTLMNDLGRTMTSPFRGQGRIQTNR